MSDGTKACSRNSKGLDHRIYWGGGRRRAERGLAATGKGWMAVDLVSRRVSCSTPVEEFLFYSVFVVKH